MKNIFKARNKIILFFLLFYLFGIFGFSLFRYYQIKNDYLARIDLTLRDAANSAIFVVGREFHDRYGRQNPPDPQIDYLNILKLSELARMHGIQYVYSLIKEGESVYFTASSATQEELKTGEGLSHFNDEYEEATPRLKATFDQEKELFEVSHDHWGNFRSILIPFKTESGRVFLIGADIEIGEVGVAAIRSLATSLSEAFFFILILLPLLWFLYRYFKAENLLLKKSVLEKTKELREINETLESRIVQEIENNRKKDMILNQQTRLAAMGEMIGNIAHQWRQPITALSLMIQDLHEAYKSGELDQNYMQGCVEDSHRLITMMSTTIDDFRNFFSPNKQKEEFKINEVVDRACNIMRASLENHQIALSVETEESDLMLYGFPNEYSQVIMNLLNNAKDAIIANESPAGNIRITIGKTGQRSLVSIADNGGGIPDEIIEKIFDPYFTTKHKSQGTGIGLYMSKQIIEQNMGGVLSVTNRDGGAFFTIVI